MSPPVSFTQTQPRNNITIVARNAKYIKQGVSTEKGQGVAKYLESWYGPILIPTSESHVSNFTREILSEDALLKIWYDPNYKFSRLFWGQFTKVYVQT